MIRPLLVSLLLLVSLPGTGSIHDRGETVEPGAPPSEARQEEVLQLHSVNSVRLREIMREIRQWTRDNQARDLEQPGMDRELLDGLLEQIEELLYHAELMSIGMPVTNLDENEMVIFKALASELYTQGLHLQQVVGNRQIRQIEQTYEQMTDTCQACHRLFRSD